MNLSHSYTRTTFVDTPPSTTLIDVVSRQINGVDRISNFTPMTPSLGAVVKNPVDGKIYFVCMGQASVNRDQFVFKYNPSTNVVEQMFRVGIGFIHPDTHRTATIDVDTNGNIIICFEELHATETHGGPVHVWKTSTPCDLNSMREISKISGRWSYPAIKINGNNVFISARGSTSSTSFVNTQYWYFNSTDGGSTWDAGVKLYQSDNADQIAYLWMIPDMSGVNGIAIVLNERNNATFTWTFVALIRGEIGSHVWENHQGTFSKNASSSGYVTRTEFRTNCMVVDGTTDFDTNLDMGFIKPDGSAKLVIAYQEQTGNEYLGNRENELIELRYYFYSSGWQHNDIDIPTGMVYYWAYHRSTTAMIMDESFEDVFFIDRSDMNNVYRKRSSDNFATQTDTLVIAGNSNWRFGGIPLNTSEVEDEVLILVDTQGDEFDTSDNSDYSNLLVIQV